MPKDNKYDKNYLFNKDFGQNFLQDEKYLKKIENCLDVNNKNILEIGPGGGYLTDIIIKKNPKMLTIVEIDKRLYNDLLTKFNNFNNPKLNIINNDCLKIDLNYEIIITNLPYNISNDFLIKLYYTENVQNVYIMLQKELAEKILKSFKDGCILSILLKILFEIEILFYIPPSAFIPKPSVQSAFLKFSKKNNIYINQKNKDKILNITKILINNKNKKIKNLIETNDEFHELRPINLSQDMFLQIISKYVNI